jgi:hypothetical protein
MLAAIIIEIVLALIVLFAGGLFWQLRKRARFLAAAIRSDDLLRHLITREALEKESPDLAPFAEKKLPTYALHVQIVVDADRLSQNRTTLIFAALIVAALVGSYFLGWTYPLINIALFCLSAFSPLSPSARSNAFQHIFSLALILKQWRAENPQECDQWVQLVPSLGPIYNAVKLVR